MRAIEVNHLAEFVLSSLLSSFFYLCAISMLNSNNRLNMIVRGLDDLIFLEKVERNWMEDKEKTENSWGWLKIIILFLIGMFICVFIF